MEAWTKRLYDDLAADDANIELFDADKEKGILILYEMLRGEYRKLLSERYKECMTYREIAELYGCSYQNIERKINRTLQRIKNSWCGGLIHGFDTFISECLVEDSVLSKKAWAPLKRSGINTLEDMRAIGKDGLSKVRWLGKENLQEINDNLSWLFDEDTSYKIRIALKKRKWSDIKISEFLTEIGLI